MIGNWLVLTAGLGSIDFENAAARVARMSNYLPGVTKAIAVQTSNLEELAPISSVVLREWNPKCLKGYGYWRYKSELIKLAFDGFWGEFDGVIWIDAGCEINLNPISRHYFKVMLRHAKKYGAFTYALNTPENLFTKKSVLEYFSSREISVESPQIQATWFILSGQTGKSIVDEWFFLAESRPDFFDDSLSENGESSEFVAHRHDQSILSLICKSKGIRAHKYTPTSGPKSLKSGIRCSIHPIWNSRNHSGTSVIPKMYKGFNHSTFTFTRNCI
jgi:hypothetical protein